jgi:hypothetical protein
MPTREEDDAVAALLAAAEKMVQAVEASPTLLIGSFGVLLCALLAKLRALYGPSPTLDRLHARIAAVRAACVPAGAMNVRIEAARHAGSSPKTRKAPRP